jgi:hypothetical protein
MGTLGFGMALTISCRATAPRADENRLGEAVTTTAKPVDRAPKYSELLLWDNLPSQADNPIVRVGVASCKLDHAYVSCVIRNTDGVESLLDAAVSSGLRHQMIGQRKELEFESRVLADVACDKTESSLPPYSSAAAQCRFGHVRAFNEAVIDGDLALELLSLTRGDAALSDQKDDSTGVISCQVVSRKIQVNCSMRRVMRAGISDDARVLARGESVALSEKMIETLQEIRKYSGDATTHVIPGELAGSVRCAVDDAALETAGRRSAQCVIRM